MKEKYFELEIFGEIYKKITHNWTSDLWAYSFNYSKIKIFAEKYSDDHLHLNSFYGIYLIILNETSEVYIGQTTNGVNRIVNKHNFIEESKIREIYNEIDFDPRIIFISLPESKSLTKNHLDYFESNLIEKVTKSIYKLGNGNNGNKLNLSSKEMNYSGNLMKYIYDLLEGLDLFLNSNNKIDDKDIFLYNGNGFKSSVLKSNLNWKLLKRSCIKLNNRHEKNNYLSLLDISKNIIIDGILQEDIVTSSISKIAKFVSGSQTANGWTLYKNKKGKTLYETYRKDRNEILDNQISNVLKISTELRELKKYFGEKILKKIDSNLKEEEKKFYYKIFNEKETIFTYTLSKKLNKLNIFTNYRKEYLLSLNNQKIKISDYTNIGHWGTGDVMIEIKNNEDIDYFIELIKK